jgi:antitoxin component HigA of HigAB toxin-antitoxin module
MSEHMKVQTTGDFADISIRVPAAQAARVCAVIENVLALLPVQEPGSAAVEEGLYSVEEVFPDMQPGSILRGARHREGLTQVQLAALIGAKPSHISEMEKGKRPIGKDMAKRLAQALNTSYRVFL